jgi:formamidopyrimidine-DNA glycosylase
VLRCTIPEGVEVKISSELIRPLVVGKLVGNLFVGNKSRYASAPPEGFNEFQNSYRKLEDIGYIVSSVKITDVAVKGKFMYWTFDNGWYMFSTFGMTGQWSPQDGKHMCLGIRLYDPDNAEISHIYFNDPRHFGSIKFISSEKELKEKLSELGWDPLNKDRLTTPWLNWLKSELSRSDKPIGQVLLDQSLFAGVGNYIRAEALYHAQMSPWRISKSLSREDLEKLCQSIVTVMEESYKYQGATLLTYKDAYGNEGRYSSCFKVYGRDIDPLGNIIKKESTPEGRTIHWCPTIQI